MEPGQRWWSLAHRKLEQMERMEQEKIQHLKKSKKRVSGKVTSRFFLLFTGL